MVAMSKPRRKPRPAPSRAKTRVPAKRARRRARRPTHAKIASVPETPHPYQPELAGPREEQAPLPPPTPTHPAPHIVLDEPLHDEGLANWFSPARFREPPQLAPAQPLGDRLVEFMARRSVHMAAAFLILAAIGACYVLAALRSAFGFHVGDMSLGLGAVALGIGQALVAQLGYSAQHFAGAR